MPNSKEDPKTENKEDFRNKNLFKRFKINLKTFEIEKSDFDQKLSIDKYDEENTHRSDREKENPNQKEKAINEFEDEIDFILKDNDTEKNREYIEYNDFDEQDNQESLFLKKNETIEETTPLASKIKETIFNYPERFPILSILGILIGISLIATAILILLGSSDKVVDNVISGETSASSVLICFIGILFIVLSLLKVFPQKKVFGNIFHTIKNFESDVDENRADTRNDKITLKSQDED